MRKIGKIESKIVVAKPVEEVFSCLLNLENSKDFDPGVESVTKITDGPIGTGTTFQFYEQTPPSGKYQHTAATYTLIEPNKRIDFTAKIGSLTPTGSFIFEKVKNETRVIFEGSANPAGIMKLFTVLINRQAKKVWDKRLLDFKNWIENRSI